MKSFVVHIFGILYRRCIKPIFFLINPEKLHNTVLSFGHVLGKHPSLKKSIALLFKSTEPALTQNVCDITFASPLGLAAGFDYEAQLTQILPALGFGFGTVGTITNLPYAGNPSPMLGRLPQSRALMVNKGFKNRGIAHTLETLAQTTFSYPVGLSIGKTNTQHATQADAIADIVSAFRTAEHSAVSFSYYELNISCPNLKGTIEFYEPYHLRALLDALATLTIHKPVFVKMPIAKTNEEICSMLDVITRYPWIQAVIIGNLQKDRRNPALISDEVQQFPHGNFSGLPCKQRSNELIELVYCQYGSHITIIGCGGVFSAKDAYEKIRRGASLVQLITGLIFEGPQLVSEINKDLVQLLRHDGYTTIREAVGSAIRP